MDTIKFGKRNVKMVAHRGLSGIEKENTAAAFVAAGNRSYFGIETDVHRTLDGKYVVIHDDTTGRVAVDNLEVEKSTFDTLRGLLLCDKDGKKGRSDIRIPTLQEYIGICKKYEKTAVLELKNRFAYAEIEEIVGIVKAIGWLEKTIFISFDLDNLIDLRKMLPDQSAQYLVDRYEDGLIDTLKKYSLDLDIQYRALNEERVAELRGAGIIVNCWTCDDPEAARQLEEYGVDYITSNILE